MTTPSLSPFFSLLRPFRATAFKLRCDTEDGVKVVTVLRKGQKVWLQKTAAIVEDLAPTRFEVLDETDSVIGVWNAEQTPLEAKSYDKEEEDTSDERLLKTVAHIIADAYKDSKNGLLEVVKLQSEVFQQERQAMSASMQSMEHALRRLLSQAQRVRSGVETPDEGGGGEEGEDDFLEKMMGAMLKKKMRDSVTNGAAAAADPAPNGNGNGAS